MLRRRTEGAPDVLSAPCPSCDGADNLPSREYVYLLGLYLGDGWIGEHRRAVHRLNVYLDSRYRGIVSACADAMEAVRPGQPADRCPKPTANKVIVRMYSRHWPCLFPQHGAGTKHTRPIGLAGWQQDLNRIGVEWRASGRYTTNVSKRASVEKLDQFIGPKS